MTTKQKRVYTKKAAGYVADLILDSLERLPEEERQVHLKLVHDALSGGSGEHNTTGSVILLINGWKKHQ